jgi:hypothetical protein
MSKKVLFTKAKEILISVWGDGEDDSQLDDNKTVKLDYVVADSLTVNQDDADENTVDCETSDAPILNDYTAGNIKVDLNNASLDADFLTNVMGWIEIKATGSKAGTGYASPQVQDTRYIALQIKFSDEKYVFLPKIAISPKTTFESLKTNVAYGTLSGTALVDKIPGWSTNETGATEGDFKTAIAVISSPVLEYSENDSKASSTTEASNA